MKIPQRFQIILSLSITLIAMLVFVVLSWLFQQNLYHILVQQALEDNQVVGESILSLLKRVHHSEEHLDHVISSVQNSCDLLKLPNGGFVCATTNDGKLVAAPNLKPNQIGKDDLNKAYFSSLDRKKTGNFASANDSVYKGFYEYPAEKHSDIIVKLKHKSGLHILVHQNNTQIMQKAKAQSDRLLFWGILSSLVIGAIVYLAANFQVSKYQHTIAQQQQRIITAHKALEEQHKNTIASITYAQRIQSAILPTGEVFRRLFPEHFLFFKPRDIVSGDFYYVREQAGKIILAVADCTGHGVPGALMTMLGNEILNELIENKGITAPDKLLNELHTNVRRTLKQHETDSRDGMDIALISICPQEKKLAYAGAKNPLLYVQNGEIRTLKANSMPIGGEQREQERVFNAHELAYDAAPLYLYLFSDGLQDQFGGVEKKKFGIKRLRETLLQVHQMPFEAQKNYFEKTFADWLMNGKEKQIDDVLLVGLYLA